MERDKSRSYMKEAQRIRERLNGRDYTVGLDLGVGSIGIAAIAIQPGNDGKNYATDIVFAASRLFSSSAGATDRRQQRGMRNSIRHKAHRLRKLWQLLAQKNLMLPYSTEEVDDPATLRFSNSIIKSDPYLLRYKGLSEEISLEELGAAIYHIANHRGSSSVRSFIDDVKSKDDEKAAEQMGITSRIAKENNLDSFIEVLKVFNSDKLYGYRNKASRASATEMMPIPTRDICISEFDKLLKKQCEYYPDVLTEDYITQIKDIVFYENPKIVPEPGNCPYFPDEKKLPKASFINEERRLWESLNNIRIYIDEQIGNRIIEKKYCLDYDSKVILFRELRNGKSLSDSSIKKLLPEFKQAHKIILQGTDKKNMKIEGFRFKNLESLNVFRRLSEEQQDQYLAMFVNTVEDSELKKKLMQTFGYSEDEALFAISSTNIVSDYAPVGRSAMKILLPIIIQEGKSFAEAEEEAIENGLLKDNYHDVYDLLPYYGEALPHVTQSIAGKAWHSTFEAKIGTEGFFKPHTNPDEEKYGRIANPVVHQTLNELRKVINELITITGKKPIEITIELGRELKIGQDARDRLSLENRRNEQINQRLFDTYCVGHNLGAKYIKRFKLFEDQGMTCPYCLKSITVDDIVSGNADIDHIFPKEDTADSSFGNLVLAHTHCNEVVKKKMIPYTAFHENPDLWNKIEQFLDVHPAMANKKWRFEMTQKEYEEWLDKKTFLNRFKSDNAYVARVACEYLLSLYSKEKKYTAVKTIKGSETAMIRKAWNLNGITQQLGEKLLRPEDETGDIVGKDRSDARHHALDAIVAGYYTDSLRQQINSMSEHGVNPNAIINCIPIPGYYRDTHGLSTNSQRQAFRNTVQSFINDFTFISRKINTSRNGQLLAATQYSILATKDDNLVLMTKKLTKNLNAKNFYGNKSGSVEYAMRGKFNIPSWLEIEEKKHIDDYLEHNKQVFDSVLGNASKASEQLNDENQKRVNIGKKALPITEDKIVKRALELTGGCYYVLTNNSRLKVFVTKEPSAIQKGSAFDTGDNFCLDLYHNENGKLCGEIIRKINAANASYTPRYKKEGFTLFERIYPYDILEVDAVPKDEAESKDFVRTIGVPNIDSCRTLLVIATFTEVGKTIQVYFDNLCSSKIGQNGSKSISQFSILNARKVCLSNLGFVEYRSQILKDKNSVENN